MSVRTILTMIVAFAWIAPVVAQAPVSPGPYRWTKGDVLIYKVTHSTNVAEVVANSRNESISQLDIVKRWEVVDVDNDGIGTLHMSLIAMRNEQKRTGGDPLLFDSQNPDKSTPELREAMGKFIGKTLAIVRIDRLGKVVETRLGSAPRYESEPPFGVVFGAAALEAGNSWRRPYTLVMEPPQGTGEKYEAEQLYTCKQVEAGKANVMVTTQFKTMPDSPTDRLPLLQRDLQGTVTFDTQLGRPTSIHFNIDKTIENHQGRGSSYRFQSRYSEVLVEAPTGK